MATHEDAQLVVQILQWGAQVGLDDALSSVFAEGFDVDAAKASDAKVRTVLNFGETVGTFVKQNVLDRDLVHDLWAIEYSWRRVGPAAIRAREAYGEPRLYENYEALARQAARAGV